MLPKMKRFIVSMMFICFIKTSLAQYFQFSQYNFTPQRINPAQVGSSDYAALSFDYRNQATDGGFHLISNAMSASYPLISSTGKRWSGIGLSFLDDRSGQAGIFKTQEIGLSYAVNVTLSKYQTFSLGVKGLYQNRKIDLDGLYTGLQYVPDRGFNEGLSSGENPGQFYANYMTFSAGVYWQQVDKKGTRLAYWGISFFDFNKPEDSFMGLESHLTSTLVGSLGFRAYNRGNVSIFPELLYTGGASNIVLNAGCVTRYALKAYSSKVTHLDIITKYVIGRSGIIGLQFHQENLSIGFSYDFPVIAKNVANTGAIEVGVELRRLVTPKKRNKRSKLPIRSQSDRKVVEKKAIENKTPGSQQKNGISQKTADSLTVINKPKEDMGVRLKQKQDSVRADAEAGKFQHEPLVLEKATLHFNFEFNSTKLNEETKHYLDDLTRALIDNPDLRIQLIGHTDNIGSEKFNLKLSFYRAQQLKEYLVEKGVVESRISVDGKGLKEPLNNNSSDADRALNRRVELTILYEK